MTAMTLGSDVDVLNSLVRGELASVAEYAEAVTQVRDFQVVSEVQGLIAGHRRAARALAEQVVLFGGDPADLADEAEAPGVAADATAGGVKAVLERLRRLELREIARYEAAADSGKLPCDCLRLIRSDLVPACRGHIVRLDALLAGLSL